MGLPTQFITDVSTGQLHQGHLSIEDSAFTSLDCAELVIQAKQDRVGLLNHLGYPFGLGSDMGRSWDQGLVYLFVLT